MANTSQPIKNFIRGDTRVLAIPITKSDGTAFDLTGCEVFFTVNASNNPTADNDSSAVIALKQSAPFSCPAACTVNGVSYTTNQNTTTSGIAWLTITNTISQDIAPGTYYYDVQLKDSSGNITSLLQNQFTVVADITRSIS